MANCQKEHLLAPKTGFLLLSGWGLLSLSWVDAHLYHRWPGRQETHILDWEGGRDFPVRTLTKLAVPGSRDQSQFGWVVSFWVALARINKNKQGIKQRAHPCRQKEMCLYLGEGACWLCWEPRKGLSLSHRPCFPLVMVSRALLPHSAQVKLSKQLSA